MPLQHGKKCVCVCMHIYIYIKGGEMWINRAEHFPQGLHYTTKILKIIHVHLRYSTDTITCMNMRKISASFNY
jgi:hypothetical protein